MGSLEKRRTGGILESKSISGAAGKVMVVSGSGALLVSLLAAFLPFVGVMGVAIAFIILGIFMAE